MNNFCTVALPVLSRPETHKDHDKALSFCNIKTARVSSAVHRKKKRKLRTAAVSNPNVARIFWYRLCRMRTVGKQKYKAWSIEEFLIKAGGFPLVSKETVSHFSNMMKQFARGSLKATKKELRKYPLKHFLEEELDEDDNNDDVDEPAEDLSSINAVPALSPSVTSHEHLPNLEWVKCTVCQKRRFLPIFKSVRDLPADWNCSMMAWKEWASCDAPSLSVGFGVATETKETNALLSQKSPNQPDERKEPNDATPRKRVRFQVNDSPTGTTRIVPPPSTPIDKNEYKENEHNQLLLSLPLSPTFLEQNWLLDEVLCQEFQASPPHGLPYM